MIANCIARRATDFQNDILPINLKGAPRKAAPWEPSRKPVRRRMALRLTRRSRFRLAAGDVPCSETR